MSEISVLSNQYTKLVTTSDRINGSVITVKKHDLVGRKEGRDLHPKISVSEQEFKLAKENLVKFLTQIFSLINEENQPSEDIPLLVIEDYLKKLNEDAYFKENLKELIEALTNEKELNDSDMRVLDRVISVLDSERTLLFRKLRTARG
jgi:hypothetical protein